MRRIPRLVIVPGLVLAAGWFFCLPVGGFAADSANGPIGALGTLRPKGGVTILAGPGGSTIAEVLVSANEAVRKGQVMAHFSNRKSAEAELNAILLERDELVANNRNDVRLKQLDIVRAQSDSEHAEHSLSNYMAMGVNAQAPSIRDDRRNQMTDAQHRLKVRQIELESLQTRFKVAEAKLENRQRIAEITLANTQLTAPFDGVVLEVRKRVGENSGGDIFSFGDLSTMQVEAEVFEGDLARLRVGQTATISSKSLPGVEKASVVSIGRLVNVDRKVAKILLAIDKCDPASRYVGMEVNVTIQP